MSKSIHRALRPLLALAIVGAWAALTLLAMANGKPAAAAQQADGSGNSAVVSVTGALAHSGDPNAALADAAAVAARQALPMAWESSLSDSTLALGDVMTPAETGADIIRNGVRLGRNIVGRDDRLEIEFTVTSPPFRPGNKNLLCMGDDATERPPEKPLLTAAPPALSLSQAEVRPNESIIIRGSGFSKAANNELTSAQIGGVALLLVSDGGNLADVAVSDSGQFAATFAIWPANASDHNPTLNAGTLEIEITDRNGFSGTAEVTILTPTLTITPDVAAPLHYAVISGANWPAANRAGGAVSDVNINVSGGGIDSDSTSASTDANGNWFLRYRVPGKVSIPSTLHIKAAYGADISQIASFNVMAANLEITPAAADPGDTITLNAAGFARYASNITVKIAVFDLAVPAGAAADGAGQVKGLKVTVPSLDDGTYTVLLQAGSAVAVGEVTLPEEFIPGDCPLPDALAPLGDNLVRVFHFNSANRTWSFYDPRPEFAELNTLSVLSGGQSYWILVRDSASVRLSNATRNLTCRNGACWNSIVW